MYAKLFSQIYDGTLCTKGPWEALVTFQQFLVLADPEGQVDMTAEAISRRTTIPLEIIQRGIESLIQPDPDSRTPAAEGRRLIPLSPGRAWGWMVVNYKHYRELKREEDRREYHRQYWHQRKLNTETQQLNKNSTASTESTETIDNRQKTVKTERAKAALSPAGFDAFWEAYPRKRHVGKAEKAWAKVNPDDALRNRIMVKIEAFKRSPEWTKNGGKYIPYPASWLNAKGWEDEVNVEAVAKMYDPYDGGSWPTGNAAPV